MPNDFTPAFQALCNLWGVADLDDVPPEKIKAMSPDEYKHYWYERIMRHGREHATDRNQPKRKPTCSRCFGKGHIMEHGRVKSCPCKWPDRLRLTKREANLPEKFWDYTVAGYEQTLPDCAGARKTALHFLDDYRSWRSGGSSPPRGIWLHGDPGSRKTTLACAVANGVLTPGSRDVFYLECPELSLWVQLAIRGDGGRTGVVPDLIRPAVELQSGEVGVLAPLFTVPLLIFDELSFGKNAETVSKWFGQILYARSKTGRPTIVTTNHSETEVTKHLELRYKSRLRELFDWHGLKPVDGRLGGGFGKRAS